MAGKVTNWSLLAIAVACVGLSPGAAAYSIGSVMYGEGVSVSYTSLDDYDLWEGAAEASVSSTLSFNGSQIDLGYGWDFSLAEVEFNMDVGPGSYEVVGEHQIYSWYYGWMDLEETSGDFDDGGDGDMMCEASYYVGSGFDGDEYAAYFQAALGYWGGYEGCNTPEDTTFYPGTVAESITGKGSSCIDPNTGSLLDVVIEDDGSWGVCPDSTYGCGGLPDDEMSLDIDAVDRVQASITAGMQGACSGWFGLQQMSYNGGAPYWYNDVGIDLDGTNGTGIRGNASGSIY